MEKSQIAVLKETGLSNSEICHQINRSEEVKQNSFKLGDNYGISTSNLKKILRRQNNIFKEKATKYELSVSQIATFK